MKRIKKLISILVLFFFVAELATFIIPAQQEADDLPIIITNEEENINILENLYPVTNFPPKSEYALSLIDPDPEPPMSFEDLPSQFSWLDYGGDWSTPAKNQANCGSCWAFGAIGALEAAINIAKGDPNFDRDLSEQYVLACLSSAGSCNGGWMSEAIAYIKSEQSGSSGNGINGCPLESCMTYQAVDYIPCDDKCVDWNVYNVPPEEDDILWQINNYGVTQLNPTSPSDWDLLKTWIITYGPVTLDIYASSGWQSFWNSHHSPNDVYAGTESGTTNHAQVVYGWVDDTSVYNGGYWILKNSWGEGFGYNGFNNLAYGCLRCGDRDVTWVTAIEWPQQPGPGGDNPPVDYDLAVFSNFEYVSKYLHPGDKVVFTDKSEGDVALREWDFNGDGIIDSNQKNPTHTYYEQGSYEVTLTVTNAWGLSSNRTRIIDVKEIWPPVAVLPSEYSNKILTYSFDGRYSYDPDGSITSYHWDFGDGTTSDKSYTTHTFPEPDKIYDVTLTLTDNEGAKGSKTCKLKIDQTVPPVTEIVHGIGSFDSEWYKETQRISFSATDWTSVSYTYYRIDNGAWKKYPQNEQPSIAVASEGVHVVEAYSIDYWGNQETPVSETFYIDKTEPTLDVTITGGEQINGWYTNPVTVGFIGEDTLSGLYKIMYSLDYGAWLEYKNPITIGEGFHELCAFAVDNAGNANQQCIKQVKVDSDIPKTACLFFGEGSNNRFYKNVEMRIIGSDRGSGIKDTFYNLDDEGYRTYYQPIIIDTLGEHTVEYYSVDYIGNQEQKKTTTFTISNLNFDLEITEPTNGLYLFGMRLLPIQKTILIGTAEIDVTITAFTQEPANIDHVDFLLDGDIQKTVTEYPYLWSIDQKITGIHTIEVIAYTSNDETISDEITATLLII